MAEGNIPLIFGGIMAGGVLLMYGTRQFRASFDVSRNVTGPVAAGAGGALSPTPGSATSGTLPPTQLAQLAKQAGFTGQNLQIAVAVALAESGGQVDNKSYNSSPPSVDRGLWQINSLYNSDTTDACAYNALCNAQAAFKYFTSRGWHDWTTYTTGRYQQFMGTAAAAVAAIGGG